MVRTLALLLLLLASCSMLIPDVPSLPSISPAPASTTVGAISQDVENSLWQYSMLSILLVFFFPSMRAPITFFLKAIFGILAIGPDLATKHLRYLYYNKYPQNKEKENEK